MKLATAIPFKINATTKQLLICAAVALFVSVISSITTYQIVSKKVPKIAVVDLLYLNNEFTMNLARYLTQHHASDEQVSNAVKDYLANLQTLLGDITQTGNYLLLQKQTVVSEKLPDITKDLEKVLFETVVSKAKFADASSNSLDLVNSLNPSSDSSAQSPQDQLNQFANQSQDDN